VEIHAGGRLVGEVSSPVFQIDRGAIFQGVSSMPDEPTKSEIEGPGS
jgi:cytoskeletal protein CcmA (bactofilin family)